MSQGKIIIATSLSVIIGLFFGSCSTLKSMGVSFSDDKTSSSIGQSKISHHKADNYTIQIATGADADRLQQSLNSNPVNCEIYHFQIKQGKNDREHVMTCGSFSSLSEANSVMLSLPAEMNTSTSGIYQWKALQQRATND